MKSKVLKIVVFAFIVIVAFYGKKFFFPSEHFLKSEINIKDYVFTNIESRLKCLSERRIEDSSMLRKLLQNARKSHHSFKYLRFCEIELRNKNDYSLIIIKVIDSALIKFKENYYILDRSEGDNSRK